MTSIGVGLSPPELEHVWNRWWLYFFDLGSDQAMKPVEEFRYNPLHWTLGVDWPEGN